MSSRTARLSGSSGPVCGSGSPLLPQTGNLSAPSATEAESGERPGVGSAPTSGAPYRRPGDVFAWAAGRTGAGMLAVAALLFVGNAAAPEEADELPRGVSAVVDLPVQHVPDVETSASEGPPAPFGAGIWAAGATSRTTPTAALPGSPSP